MRNTSVSLLALMCLAVPAIAQAPYLVGFHDKDWQNTSGAGSAVIDVRVYYPAVHPGEDADVLPKAGGWPVVFFLHGYGMLGSEYEDFGVGLAKSGFAAVMIDTARYNPVDLEHDARALYSILDNPANTPKLLRGALDMHHVGLVGHSMGGAVAAFLLADSPTVQNPGFDAGVAMAPVYPGPIAGLVGKPFGIVSGGGDQVTVESLHADPFYDDLHPESGLKFHYSMGAACDHDSLVGINVVGGQVNYPVFYRASTVAQGFMRHYLVGDGFGLGDVFGSNALADVNFDELKRQAVLPQMWIESSPEIGDGMRLYTTSENGYGAVLASGGTIAPLPTVLGDLQLDPATTVLLTQEILTEQQLNAAIILPPDPNLVGATLGLQALGITPTQELRLGQALGLTVQ